MTVPAIGSCPLCKGWDCKHFLGWTSDGERYSWMWDAGKHPIPEGAIVVRAIHSTDGRVYQESGFNPRLIIQPKD